jgi:hypothetical protein
MIHHISIPANNPSHVADVLAELMDGRSYPFPGGVPDSFMAVSGDRHGTMIEVYPADMTLEPNGTPHRKPGQTAQRGPFHILLSVPLSREQIEAIGNREGWTTRFCGRGAPGQKPFFHLVEVWVEDHFMLEVAPQSMVGDYEKLIQFEVIDQVIAKMGAAQPA